MYRLVLTLVLALAMPGVLPHPRSDCPNPIEMAQKMMMASITQVQNAVQRPKVGCIKAWRKDEMALTYEAASCIVIEFVPPLLKAILKDDVVSSGNEIKTMWLSAMRCGLKDTGLMDKEGNLNLDEYQKKNRAVSGEDAHLSNEWLRVCVKDNSPKKGSKVAGEVTVSAIVSCYLEKHLDYCEKENKDSGPVLPILYALNSMYKDGECPVVVPPTITEAHLTCMDKGSVYMGEIYRKRGMQENEVEGTQENGRKSDKQKMEELMAKAFQFQRDYQTSSDFYNKCVVKDLGFLTPDGKKVNGMAFIDFLEKNFTGWTGNQLEQMKLMFEECYGRYTDQDGFAPVEGMFGEEGMKIGMKVLINCALPKYVRTCGMNNQFSHIIFGLFNEEVAEKAITMNKGYAKFIFQSLFSNFNKN